MSPEPRRVLAELVVRYGRDLTQDARRCEALLRDLCGGDQYRREIFVLVSAVREQVPADLLSSSGGVPKEVLLDRLSKRMHDDLGIAEGLASWAVESWALALEALEGPDPIEAIERLDEPQARAEAHHTAFQAALELKRWEDTLAELQKEIKSRLADFAVVLERLNSRPVPKPTPAQPAKKHTNSLGMTLVRIEPGAGSFLMGSTKDQIDQLMRLFPDSRRGRYDDEQPQHPVKITRPFFLGIHQVTQGQYQAVMGENPSDFKGSDDRPVEHVSWLDAVLFCNKLSEQEKKTPIYRINGTEVTIAGGNGYRLPTEAEWEYACRAGSATLYPFGDEAGKLGDHAWYDGNSGRETHAVGQKQANAWGLYDMLGNVWEWCADWYDAKYYGSSPSADPTGPLMATNRVIRGGCWINDRRDVRSAYRYGNTPDLRSDYLGFRVAAVRE